MSDSKKNNDEDTDKNSQDKPTEFVIGVVTFILFLVFMAIWMYFSTSN